MLHTLWEAVSRGELDALASALAPDACWRAVEDGPWNCSGRPRIIEVLSANIERIRSGALEEALEVGDRVVVAFRPGGGHEPTWPLDHGRRYVVVSFRSALISELKGCVDREAALSYAAAG